MARDPFAVPVDDRYFDDYLPGAVHEYGPIAVEEDEIVAFGRRFDPQAFHIDPQAARETSYGGLIASGWHTAALMMRLFSDHYLSKVASLGSPGVDELRWRVPVRPGDRLWLRVTVMDGTRRSRSRPDRGIVFSRIEMRNQDGATVMDMTAMNLLACRPVPAAATRRQRGAEKP